MSCSLVHDDDVSRIHHKGEEGDDRQRGALVDSLEGDRCESVFIDFPPLWNSFNLNCLYSSAPQLPVPDFFSAPQFAVIHPLTMPDDGNGDDNDEVQIL